MRQKSNENEHPQPCNSCHKPTRKAEQERSDKPENNNRGTPKTLNLSLNTTKH